MSHPTPHNDDFSDSSDEPLTLKPKPHPYKPSSPPPSAPSTPPPAQLDFPADIHTPPKSLNARMAKDSTDGSITPSRTRSFLNLTSSTLFGIYNQNEGEATPYGQTPWQGNTPWGTGAQTPAEERSPVEYRGRFGWDAPRENGHVELKSRRKPPPQQREHHMPRRGFRGYVLPLVLRLAMLFSIGVGYALLITHLHDQRNISPVRVKLDRSSWRYLLLWGAAGVIFGSAMPWFDTYFSSESEPSRKVVEKDRGLDGWLEVVRAMCAFVGVAFAIRKLPWTSSLQLSATLALANPAIWYLIDRTPPGFLLSSFFAISGTVILLGVNPALVPSPSPAEVLRGLVQKGEVVGRSSRLGGEELVLGVFSPESLGVATWIASVLFVSSVCFGNVGRRLARGMR